jgi:hypothetical protein
VPRIITVWHCRPVEACDGADSGGPSQADGSWIKDGSSKFSGELKVCPLDDFYQVVTGVCGEPDVDLAEGMRREHTKRPDSDVEFWTPNGVGRLRGERGGRGTTSSQTTMREANELSPPKSA